MDTVKTTISTIQPEQQNSESAEKPEPTNNTTSDCVPNVQDCSAEQPTQSVESTKPKRKRKGYSKNGKKLGRPSKQALETVKEKKNPVGRPKGDNSVIQEYKARMLASPNSAKVLEAVLSAASDPDHKNFTAAAKLVLDRILPVSAFEEVKKQGGRTGINITITGVDGSKTVIGEDIDEADYEEVE